MYLVPKFQAGKSAVPKEYTSHGSLGVGVQVSWGYHRQCFSRGIGYNYTYYSDRDRPLGQQGYLLLRGVLCSRLP